jgi:hypothetical protein
MWRFVAILTAVLTSGPMAFAGWLTVKNDTKHPILVEEVIEGPILKRGRTIRLQPGETYREFSLVPGEKKVHIYQIQDKDRTKVCTGCLKWQAKDIAMSIETKTVLQKLEWSLRELIPTVK